MKQALAAIETLTSSSYRGINNKSQQSCSNNEYIIEVADFVLRVFDIKFAAMSQAFELAMLGKALQECYCGEGYDCECSKRAKSQSDTMQAVLAAVSVTNTDFASDETDAELLGSFLK